MSYKSNTVQILDAYPSKLIKNIATKTISLFAVTFISLSTLMYIPANAQNNENGRGIVITPAILELEADKNLPYDLSVNVQNDSSDDNINLIPKIYTFDSVKDDGTPNVKTIEENSPQNSWIKFADSQISLNKGEKKDSKISVLVPENASAGSYYFALTYAQGVTASNSSGQKLNINREIAALLFLTVKGDVKRDVQLNDIQLSNSTIDPFFDNLNINYKIKLDGNAYVKPAGNIFTGNDLSSPENTLNINPNQRIILPNTSRSFTTQIKPILNWMGEQPKETSSNSDVSVAQNFKHPWFGSQNISFKIIFVNNEGKLDQKTAQVSVWFIPWRFLILILVLVIGIVGVVYILKRQTKKNK